MGGQRAELEWKEGGVPVSRRFDDPYFSLEDGLAETRHVFLAGNDLPARFRPGFHIAELGFGTGLNLFAALMAWREAGIAGPLRFTSFEAYPMDAGEMELALKPFPEIPALAGPFLDEWHPDQRLFRHESEHLVAEIIFGDARKTLPEWQGVADAWFLDGFAPSRNPELWEAPLMAAVGAHTRPGGTAATYSAAGDVRRALESAGFIVEKAPGFGRKRHMTRARKPGP